MSAEPPTVLYVSTLLIGGIIAAILDFAGVSDGWIILTLFLYVFLWIFASYTHYNKWLNRQERRDFTPVKSTI